MPGFTLTQGLQPLNQIVNQIVSVFDAWEQPDQRVRQAERGTVLAAARQVEVTLTQSQAPTRSA